VSRRLVNRTAEKPLDARMNRSGDEHFFRLREHCVTAFWMDR
jgi:hypothetical protein